MMRADIVKEKMNMPADTDVIFPYRENENEEGRFSFFSSFVLKKTPRRALMFLTGSDYFEVLINGDNAAEYAVRSYAYHRAYEVYDITRMLIAGENSVAVDFCDSRAPVFRGFVCEINLDGKRMPLTWSCARDTSKNYVPHFISGGGFEISGISKTEKNIACGRKKLELPEGVSLYQSVLPPQTRNEINPISAFVDGLFSYPDGEMFSFDAGSPSLFLTTVKCKNGADFSMKFIKSVHSAYIDGKEIANGSVMTLYGDHVLSLFTQGGNACFELKTNGATDDFRHVRFDAPRRVYRYPWNDNIQPYKMPDDIAEFIKNTANIEDISRLDKAEQKTAPSYTDIISLEKKSDVKEILPEKYITKGADFIASKYLRHVVFDFGCERVGLIKIEFESEKNVALYFRSFELFENGIPRDMGEKSGGVIAADGGKSSFTSRRMRGLRYVSVFIPADTEIRCLKVSLIETRCNTSDAGAFSSGDKKLDDIYKMSIDTAAVCMLDSYVDCPGYEQNIWVGDAGITGKINMTSFGEREFDARYLDMVAQSMMPGLRTYYRGSNPLYVNDTYLPCACFPTYPDGGIPIWSFTWAMHVMDHAMYLGIDEGFDKRIEAVEECLRRAETHFSSRGLFAPCGAWNLIEWANNDLSPYGEVTANNMMLCGCFKRLSDVFTLLNNSEKSRYYIEKSEKLKENINKYCWNEKRNAYVDTVRDETGYSLYLDFCRFKNRTSKPYEKYISAERVSVQTAAFAVLFDVAEGARRAACEKLITSDIMRGNYRSGTPAKRTYGTPSDEEAPGGVVRIGTPFFMYYALGALMKTGQRDLALEAIVREWGEMLDDGLKTCVETFKNQNGEWGRSAAHAWSAAPAVYLKTEVLGIKPRDFGYRKFSVEPHLCGLKYAEGAVPTPFGPIRVKAESSGGETKIYVDAPEECEQI